MSQENLVQLLDVYNVKGLYLLIYECMQNDSLAHALFARFNICLGIARGLVFLHEHSKLKMVHSDIKSANILLDGKLKAKISDFGLASLYTEDDQFKFIKVEVTEGYVAPEYVRGVVTSKADVYSFGVVILETVSRRKNEGHKRDSQETKFHLDTVSKIVIAMLFCLLFVFPNYAAMSFNTTSMLCVEMQACDLLQKRKLVNLVDKTLSNKYDQNKPS
ncbi:putative protein kinase RLK-Pelle-DLSV family [Rosa chinensis]|uniref:non-specific serine/threonine protein kinase n=1 Tax=Rosa chinensis TaxID=74649 RepID=A0A2P6Q250_ROSCH|nr:putative protein kinase RLK-Pelle-DLSV family [Rosa chinensis]